MARNILDLAPHAVLTDVPLIPPRIRNIPAFVSTAQVVYQILTLLIAAAAVACLVGRVPGSWSTRGRSSTAARILRHSAATPRTCSWRTPADQHRHPGGAVPSRCGVRCRQLRRVLPERALRRPRSRARPQFWGANAHPLVITVGAVRTDETWLGYSSQGPGPTALAN